MPWKMQSDRSGKVYEFADDVSPEDALRYLDEVLEKPVSAGQTLQAVVPAFKAGLGQSVRQITGPGFVPFRDAQSAQDLLRKPDLTNIEAAEQQAMQNAMGGGTPSTVQKGVISAAQSIGANILPMLSGAGVATTAARAGAPATQALSKGVTSTLKAAAAQEGGREYEEQREAGASIPRAAVHAGVAAGAEYVGEKFAFTPIQKLLKTGDSTVKKAVFEFLFRDQVGEQLTTSIQWLNRKLSREPDLTLADLQEEMAITAISTGIAGPVQGAVAGPTMALATRPARTQDVQPGEPATEPAATEPPTEAPAGELPVLDDVVEPTIRERGKGESRVVNESELPIIGEEPGDREAISRALPLEQQLELLRSSWEDYQNKTAFDTAEDRIRKKGEFLRRRAEVEQALQFNPEARALIRESDKELGIRTPDLQQQLEQEVDEFAVLTPEQIEQRRVVRETEKGSTDEAQGLDQETAETLGLVDLESGRQLRGPQYDWPVSEDESYLWGLKSTQEHLRGRQVLDATRPELRGMSFEQVLQTVRPDDIVYLGQPGQENLQGAPWLMNMLQDLKATYLPNSPLYIGEIPNRSSGYFSAAWPVERGGVAMALPRSTAALQSFTESSLTNLDPGVRMRMRMDSQSVKAVDTVLHEFTHLIHMKHWRDSSAAEKAAVAREYHADLRFAADPSTTVEAALYRLYSPAAADLYMQSYLSRGGKKSDIFTSPEARARLPMFTTETSIAGVASSGAYWFNFNEWMAHKGVKYFQTRAGVSKENVPFFKRFIQAMQRFYRDFIVKYGNPGRGFAQWMDNIAARESGQIRAMSAEEIAQVRDELVAEGVQPEIADMLAAVRGTDEQLIRRIKERARDDMLAIQSAEAEEQQFRVLGDAVKVLTKGRFKSKEQLLRKLQPFGIARDLAQHPLFADRLNQKHFVDSVIATMFNSRNVELREMSSGQYYTFAGKFGRASVGVKVYENVAHIYLLQNDYYGAAETLVNHGLVAHVNRKLSDRGIIHARVEGMPQFADYYGAVEPGSDVYEIPFYQHQAPIRPELRAGVELTQRDPEWQDVKLPAGLDSLGEKFNLPWFKSAANSTARFNKFLGRTLGMFQMIKLNEHLPGVLQLRDALRNRMMYRHQWISVSNEHLEDWAFRIPKTQATALGNLLFAEDESGTFMSTIAQHPDRPGHYIFRLDPKAKAKYKLSDETAELYSHVRNDFMRFADEWHKVALWELARSEMSDTMNYALAEAMRKEMSMGEFKQIFDVGLANIADPRKVARIDRIRKDIDDQFDSWKKSPYMPHTRFGRYGVLVRDAETQATKYFEGFEDPGSAREAAERLRKDFPKDAVSTTYLEDVPYMLAGLPPAMLQAMQKRLALTPEQMESFAEILRSLSTANSFAHRQARKKDIAGYSLDAMRAYGDYFRRGSGFLARVKSSPELSDALSMLKKHIAQQTKRTDGIRDVTKLGQLHEYFQRQIEYLNNPGNEFGEVKSFMSIFFFAFNASTAAINMTQVPFVTLPWMSERYGLTESTTELTKAYKDAIGFYFKGDNLADDEMRMLDFARSAGFRDQSQATTLAQIADGSALARVTPISAWKRGINTLNHYGMWMFSKGELLNRDVTLLSVYRLEKKNVGREGFDRNAYDKAREAVEMTHNEYGRENRPDFMHGAGSVVFQFMHYVQNMLFLQLGGDKSWWRLLLVQLGISGFLGLPFASDILNAAKFIGRQVFGKDWDVEREVRQYLSTTMEDPDMVLRGMMSDVWGFDLSRRISLGEVVPGMEALGSHRKFDEVMGNLVGDAAGPAISQLMNVMKFVSAEDKTEWQALKNVVPSSIRNFGNAAKAFNEGAVKDLGGATLYEPDTARLVGMGFGFLPKELSEAYRARSMQQEQANFWTQRRSNLLKMYQHIVLSRDKDREAMADFMKRLKAFNASAPDPKLVITGDTLRNSLREKVRSNLRKEAGLGSTPSMQGSAAEISRTFGR